MKRSSFKIILFFVLGFFALHAQALSSVKFVKSWQIPAREKLQKMQIGGLSGCSKNGEEIYFVSDDRGQMGTPRILVLKWNESSQELVLNSKKWLLVQENKKTSKTLDLEGLAVLGDQQILLSNEGDLDKKPQQSAEVFVINKNGGRVQTISLSDKFKPNLTGQQTQGTQNNLGFEGVSYDSDAKKWGLFLEGPLVQDSSKLILVESKAGSISLGQEWSYDIPQFIGDGLGAMMGVTDFLYKTSHQLLVIERGVDMSLKGMNFNAQLCWAEKQTSKSYLKKDCFYDFAQDERFLKVHKKVGNYEGICWLNSQKTKFLVVNDNNFSKSENNLFLLYQID